MPGTSLHLVDANGQDLGIPLSVERGARRFTTYLPNEGVVLQIVGHGRKEGGTRIEETDGIRFLKLDCQGDPYTRMDGSPPAIMKGGHRYFKFVIGPKIEGAQVLSILSSSTDGCVNSSHYEDIFPLEEITFPFTEPLAWPLQIVTE